MIRVIGFLGCIRREKTNRHCCSQGELSAAKWHSEDYAFQGPGLRFRFRV